LPHSFSGKQATAYEEFRILEIMLSACIYQVDRTLEAFQPSVLRERVGCMKYTLKRLELVPT